MSVFIKNRFTLIGSDQYELALHDSLWLEEGGGQFDQVS